MELIRKNIKFVFLLVLPVHFFIAQNSILNKHSHFYANGIVVTHSHPVDKEDGQPINDHKHTKTEICFFHSFHFDVFIVPGETTLKNNEQVETYYYLVFNDRIENSIIYLNPSPRGPPFPIS